MIHRTNFLQKSIDFVGKNLFEQRLSIVNLQADDFKIKLGMGVSYMVNLTDVEAFSN